MKNYSNYLLPLAVFAIFGSCLIGFLGFLVVMMAMVGFGDGLPFAYFQKLSLPILSIALPVVGMILFGAILAWHFGKRAEVEKQSYVEGAAYLRKIPH